MSGVRCRLVGFALVAALAAFPAAAVDIEELIEKAVASDIDLDKAELGLKIAEIGIAKSAASRGLKLSLGAPSNGLRLSTDLAKPLVLTASIDPTLSLSLPDPANTSVSLSALLPLSFGAGGVSLTPSLSAGVSQPLDSLIGARQNTRVREVQETLTLTQARTGVAAREAAIAQAVISSVKTLVELRLSLGDMAESIKDLDLEAEKTKALDAEGEKGAAYRELIKRRQGVEEKVRRAEREYEVRKARLEGDLGVSLDDDVPTASSAEEPVLPTEADLEKSPAVRAATLDLDLADARLEQQRLQWLPSLSAGASFTLDADDADPSLYFRLSWQVLDAGLRSLNREELEAQRELKRLTLEQSKRSFSSTLTDLELELMSIQNRGADAERALETAKEDLEEARMLLEKGLKSDREVEKAGYAVGRRDVELRLSRLDRVAFRYKLRSLVTP